MAAALWACTGCPPPTRPVEPERPPRPVPQILSAISTNAAKLDQPLWSSSVTVSARFIDEDGRRQVFNLEGSLLFQRPLNFRMDLRHGLGEPVMGIGSNDEEYWVWIEPEMGTMRWGRYRHLGKPCTEDVLIRPDHLMQSLGVGGLPEPSADLVGPAPGASGHRDGLVYLRRSGAAWRKEEYRVDRSPPFQVRGVKYFDHLGRIEMDAYLDEYQSDWPGGPYLPHLINVFWPLEQGRFTLHVDQYRPIAADKIAPRSFLRPTRDVLPPGLTRIIQIDADCETARPDNRPDDVPNGAAKAPHEPKQESSTPPSDD